MLLILLLWQLGRLLLVYTTSWRRVVPGDRCPCPCPSKRIILHLLLQVLQFLLPYLLFLSTLAFFTLCHLLLPLIKQCILTRCLLPLLLSQSSVLPLPFKLIELLVQCTMFLMDLIVQIPLIIV